MSGGTNSGAVAAGELATAAQYNNLRTDVLDTSSGHQHDGSYSAATISATTFDGAATVSAAWAFTNTITVGVDGTGKDVKFFGDTSGSFLLWDESDDALELTDSSPLKIGDGADMQVYHDGSNSYLTNATGALKLATETSGIAVTIGHTTSETTVADNLTVTGDTTLNGSVTLGNAAADVITVNGTIAGASALVFEGATSDAYETTLAYVDPTADRTVYFPNQTGYLAVLAAASTTQVTATPEEINVIDGGTSRGTDAIADGDGVLINDAGTMRMTTVETLATYMEGEINAFSLALTATGGVTLPANADIAMTGTTGTNDIVLTNGLADALSITDGSADVIVIDTSTSGNVITFTSAITASGATITGPSGTWDSGGMDIAASDSYAVAGTDILADSSGTMTLSNVDALDATTEATIEAAIDTLANLTAASALVTVGTLNSGSITSGFGSIDIGSSALSTTGTITGPSGTWDSGGMDIAASDSYAVAGTAILSDSSGTMTLSNVDVLDATTEATIEAAIDTLANLTAASALVTVGALNAGSITSGFGTIDIGSSALSATGTHTGPSGTWDAGGMDIAASDSYAVAGTDILSDSSGTMTLSNVDALDATTEATIEAAIDTLANLTAASALVTVGTLGSGAISSGFGNIDIGSSTFDATGTHTGPSGTWDSGGMDIASGDSYAISGTDVLVAATLGGGVLASSLTSVGTLSSLTMGGTLNMANNGLSDIGAAGNTLAATSWSMNNANAGARNLLEINNTNTDNAASNAMVQIQTSGGGGDTTLRTNAGGIAFQWGVDQSAGHAVITRGLVFGTTDAIRITNASPPVITYNTAHPTGVFTDYACDDCGKTSNEMFECCGVVRWRDDVMDYRSMALRDPGALDYMERVGVIQRTKNNEGNTEIFTVLGRDFEFAMSAAFQNRQRMDDQYEEHENRFSEKIWKLEALLKKMLGEKEYTLLMDTVD
jgi:uncharacterized protein with ACT and thioredoxin-like domain